MRQIFNYIFFFKFETYNKRQRLKLIVQFLLGAFLDILVMPFMFFIAFLVRILKKNIRHRIFIGCFPNNNYPYIANSLRKLGYHVDIIPFFIPEHERGVVDYSVDLESIFPRLYHNWVGSKIITYALFVWSIIKYDIFIMPFLNRILDKTVILQWFEFQLLHLANKKIILNPYGADIYTPKLTLKERTDITVLRDYESDPFYSKINESYVEKIRIYGEKHADCIVAALDLVDYLTRIDVLLQMRCIDLNSITPLYETQNKILKIIHAPNHRKLKGTQYLIDAVNKINSNGIIIDLEIIEKKSNVHLLEQIKKCDIVADQFLMGAYGRLAIEAMAYGKPVLCYLRRDLILIYKHWDESGIINTSIYDIKKE